MRIVNITLCVLLVGLVLDLASCQPAKKILVYSQDNSPFSNALPTARKALGDQALVRNWQMDFSQDAGSFIDNTLLQYDAVVFLLTNGVSLNAEQRAALQRFVKAGRGFAGISAANYNDANWDWYKELIGTSMVAGKPFLSLQSAQVRVPDRVHPSTRTLPEYWPRSDIW